MARGNHFDLRVPVWFQPFLELGFLAHPRERDSRLTLRVSVEQDFEVILMRTFVQPDSLFTLEP
jgi:hypothetical protein